MGLFSDKPYTAITAQIERLCGRSSSDEDAGDILELIEAIQIAKQPGYLEAGRAVRKQIKHGSAKQQVRGLWVLEMLIDNGGKRMPEMLEDPGLGDHIQAMSRNNDKPAKVAKAVLSGWSRREDDRLTRWVPGQNRSRANTMERSTRRSRANTMERDERYNGRDHLREEEYDEDERAERRRPVSRSPSPVNIRGGSITTTMATAHTIATRLSEAVITHPNVKHSTEARGYYKQAKDMRKRVVNLIHQDNPEVSEFLDRLLTVNEELVTSLQAFENAEDAPKRDQQHDNPPPQPRRPTRPSSPIRRRSTTPDPSPPPSPLRTPRTPRVPPPEDDDDDPFADINESTDAPLVKPMW